ncbi:MAG TPA: sodium:proton antiporter, partial [Candidatus Xenobia bacterium]
MAETVLVVTTMLGIGFLGTRISGLFRLPHSVLLVLVGMVGGAVLHRLYGGLPAGFDQTFPDLVLYVLLPPLIFESAYHLNLGDLRRDAGPILALAVVALLASCAVVGAGLHVTIGMDLASALLFGALISATDPVAVVALFKEIGAPRRLATLVEGESLLNDGIAIVVFRVLLSGGSSGNPAMQFLEVACGGVGVGLVFVLGLSRLLRWTNPSATAQLGLTVAAAYGSFIVADHYGGVSGVISTMVVGLYLGERARLELNREALHSMHVLWEFLSLCANTLIFLAVGLSMRLDLLSQGIPWLLPTLLVVMVARAVSVWVTLWPLNRIRVWQPIGLAYQSVLIWGGLRGGLALALVFILPPTVAHRQLFLVLASGVVLFTLLVNAMTTAPLLKRLGLTALTQQETSLYQESLNEVLERVVAELATATRRGLFSSQLISELQEHAQQILQGDGETSGVFHLQRFLLYEQEAYNEHVEDGILSPSAYLTLSRSVADRLALVSKGIDALLAYRFDMPLSASHRGRNRAEMAALTLALEQRLHLDLGLRRADARVGADPVTRPLREGWLAASCALLEDFYRMFPHLGIAVQAEYLAHRLDVS